MHLADNSAADRDACIAHAGGVRSATLERFALTQLTAAFARDLCSIRNVATPPAASL